MIDELAKDHFVILINLRLMEPGMLLMSGQY